MLCSARNGSEAALLGDIGKIEASKHNFALYPSVNIVNLSVASTSVALNVLLFLIASDRKAPTTMCLGTTTLWKTRYSATVLEAAKPSSEPCYEFTFWMSNNLARMLACEVNFRQTALASKCFYADYVNLICISCFFKEMFVLLFWSVASAEFCKVDLRRCAESLRQQWSGPVKRSSARLMYVLRLSSVADICVTELAVAPPSCGSRRFIPVIELL